MSDHFWTSFALIGFAGFGLGVGLVIGAFIVRALRRYMQVEMRYGHDPPRPRRPPDEER